MSTTEEVAVEELKKKGISPSDALTIAKTFSDLSESLAEKYAGKLGNSFKLSVLKGGVWS